MAKINTEVISLLACPRCKGSLTLAGDEGSLICESCRVAYPIRDGAVVMLVEEAIPLRASAGKQVETASPSGEQAVFLVVEGKSKGEKIELPKRTCRAIGRSIDDLERTQIFSVDSAVALDENSKKAVMQYLSKQFQKKQTISTEADAEGGSESLGGFIRMPDFQVRDGAVSRLHAMFFYDESGTVGILDLVSKNGTYVNGAEIESKTLKSGDLITICGSKIRFES